MLRIGYGEAEAGVVETSEARSRVATGTNAPVFAPSELRRATHGQTSFDRPTARLHSQALGGGTRKQEGTTMLLHSLAGLPAFLVYFCTGVIAVMLYLFVYMRITPHDEFQLIRDNVPAAAISLGLSLLGFVLAVVSAIIHAANVWDCLIWSVIALIVQVLVFYAVRIPVPNLSARIAAGELAPAIWLGLASLAAGALNAASMVS
jgi:putative membrane protein